MAAMSGSAALLVLGIRASEPLWIVTWLAMALGVLGLAEGPFWVTAVEVGGNRGGLSAGIFNMGGNAGGIAAPIVTPWVSDALGFGWQWGIGIGGAVCLAGAVMWLWIDPTEVVRCEPPAPLASLDAAPSSDGQKLSASCTLVARRNAALLLRIHPGFR